MSMMKQSLVLDGEKGGLLKASVEVEKKLGILEGKTMAALKSHSEAERRRKDRINAHLETLRGFVPSNKKMDEAILLAEVISEVKQLKETATQATEGLQIPMDTDEVKVEKLEKNGSFIVRATICCDYRPDLLSDLRRAIKDLPVKILKCEISTLEGRVKCGFLITANGEGNKKLIVNSVHEKLSNILDKVFASVEFDQEMVYPRKKAMWFVS